MASPGLVKPLNYPICQLNDPPEPSNCHACLEGVTFFSIPLDFQDNRYLPSLPGAYSEVTEVANHPQATTIGVPLGHFRLTHLPATR
ncbi:hypothetical protein K9N68_21400 [Kovacikia minuta CCNUW1]|uniref:hypothetical protein n=1 Tax=Kovacikia minuta TaxID=2931930 RepID=UPI001CCB7D26|nr:hypothetical protein [Kovacikia minuta]UBF24256.1 hypothetical protein K9N68_21400 [Kovacikia minuta CCNUW1]